MPSETMSHFRYRLRRDSNAVIVWFREMWVRRWFRILGYLAGTAVLALILVWAVFARKRRISKTKAAVRPGRRLERRRWTPV